MIYEFFYWIKVVNTHPVSNQRLPEQLMDDNPIPSLLLPLWQNESFCETIGMKRYVTCTVIRMKIKRFSCETFCTSTLSAIGNSDGGSKVYICAKLSIRPALIPVSVA